MTSTQGDGRSVLVTGATGFIGRALVPALVARGQKVVAVSRKQRPTGEANVTWRSCDLNQPESLRDVFAGVSVAYYLVHSMAGGAAHFRATEQRAADAFAAAAADAREPIKF